MQGDAEGEGLIDPDEVYFSAARELGRAGRVLDFGAGRGVHGKDLRDVCASIEGCDVDQAVLTNPYLHHATLLEMGRPLPYPDNHFDLIVSRYVLEHIDQPEFVAREIKRVLRPGGHFVSVTPNKNGYVALAARLIPNSLHVAVLKWVQPHKAAEDTFPTVYRLNTRADLERHFGRGVTVSFHSGEPQYYFGREWLRRVMMVVHRLLPEQLHTAMVVRCQRPS